MADKEVVVTPGAVSVSLAAEPDKDGNPQGETWTCSNPDQAEKMIPTWQAKTGTQKISAGEASAIRDAANDYRKERAKLGS